MKNERIIDEFLELVQIDSSSLNERKIADAVILKLKELGFEVDEDNTGEIIGGNTGNIFATLEGELEGSIVFTSHLDRVGNGLGIKPVIEDTKITSGGSTILAADDISGVAAILEGVRRVKENGAKYPSIEILFTVAEEKGVLGSRHFDFSKIQSKFGYALDSSGPVGRIIYAAPAKAQVEIEVFGKASHAGNAPEKGVNAITAAAKILATIKDGRIDEESTANYAIVKAGDNATNVVCDYALVIGEARSLVQSKLDKYLEYFEDHCQKAIEGTGATVKTKVIMGYKSFSVEEKKPSIRLVKQVFNNIGIRPLIERGGGGMDANNFNEHGIECVGLATGYMANHSVNEYIEIEHLVNSGKMVENIILTFNNLEK